MPKGSSYNYVAGCLLNSSIVMLSLIFKFEIENPFYA